MQVRTDTQQWRVGDVKLETDTSHENKLRVLKVTMDNHQFQNSRGLMRQELKTLHQALHQYNEDNKRVLLLMGMLDTCIVGRRLTKDEMKEMNVLFKRYGGTRKNK